jgi:hypothetical protein
MWTKYKSFQMEITSSGTRLILCFCQHGNLKCKKKDSSNTQKKRPCILRIEFRRTLVWRTVEQATIL